MARFTGPVCKLSRREGTDLQLKSRARSLDSKCKLEKVPGQTTDRRRRRTLPRSPSGRALPNPWPAEVCDKARTKNAGRGETHP